MVAPSADGGGPSLDNPRFRDDHAYVSHGMLVAQFEEALWTAALSYAPYALLPVHQLILAGSLVRVGQGWELQNLVAGMRASFNDALTSASRLINLENMVPTCEDPNLYLQTRQNICPFLDIASVQGGPASAPCDAISIGILLQAKQAALGIVLPPSMASPVVCAQGIHPETDTCVGSADN